MALNSAEPSGWLVKDGSPRLRTALNSTEPWDGSLKMAHHYAALWVYAALWSYAAVTVLYVLQAAETYYLLRHGASGWPLNSPLLRHRASGWPLNSPPAAAWVASGWPINSSWASGRR
jgi:hypothetical protein